MNILAIDPAPTKSGYVVWDGKEVLDSGIPDNLKLLLEICPRWYVNADLVIEKIACYGMAVGESVFDTVFWTGRFCQQWQWFGGTPWARVLRRDVKLHICHNSRANDSNIRQALIDRFEPKLKPRCRPKGVMRGLKKDSLQAFALAVYWGDLKSTSI